MPIHAMLYVEGDLQEDRDLPSTGFPIALEVMPRIGETIAGEAPDGRFFDAKVKSVMHGYDAASGTYKPAIIARQF